MVKQLSIEQEGTVVEALGNAMFRVELENGLINALYQDSAWRQSQVGNVSL